MIKELQKIQQRCGDILGDYPEKRAELVDRLEVAEEELRKAKNLQMNAEDMESFDDATATVKLAELVRKFAKNALNKLDRAPRMDEAEYVKAVATCKEIMETAVETHRKKAAALMDQLAEARAIYLQTAEDVNSTLIKLDEAANVLQSKYPFREEKRLNEPSSFIPDKKAWLKYALRYDNAKPMEMATESKPEDRPEPHMIHDSVLCLAWYAVDRGYPRRIY